MYSRLYEKTTARKNAQQKAVDSKKRISDDYIADAGEAYTATKKKKPSPFLSIPTPVTDDSPADQIQTHVSKHNSTSLRLNSTSKNWLTQSTHKQNLNLRWQSPISYTPVVYLFL